MESKRAAGGNGQDHRWRIIASTTFTLSTWCSETSTASGIMVASILKMVLYYFHEQAWFRYGSIGRRR